MLSKILLVFSFVVVGISTDNHCVPIKTKIAINYHIPWSEDLINLWNRKMLPLIKDEGKVDISALEGLIYERQKYILDRNFEMFIAKAENPEEKEFYVALKKSMDDYYDLLNSMNLQKMFSKKSYPKRYYLVSLQRRLFANPFFEVEVQPGERKEVEVPTKGPVLEIHFFESEHAKDYFKKYGESKYLTSSYGHEYGIHRIVYDAVRKKKLAISEFFPEQPGRKRERSPEREEAEEAGPLSSYPLKAFVDDDMRLTAPLLATGAAAAGARE